MPTSIPGPDVIVVALKDYLLRELLEDEDGEVSADDNLIAEGLIDSTGAVRMATYIEEQFGIVVRPEDFNVENFWSLNSLAVFIRTRAG